jgi:hypothetical protein
MSDERLLQLALLGALGSSGVLAMSSLFSAKQSEPLVWHQIHFGREVEEAGVKSWLHSLSTDRRQFVVALEVVGLAGSVHYRMGVPSAYATEVLVRLSSFLPGTRQS